ncbi:MAG: site-specific integrase [Shimia thalassica]|uniref:tyrosine-type recombinase/integrase n=1 Tax=Shimia thalassica TaxID=1715693 RepID=UPI0032988B5C
METHDDEGKVQAPARIGKDKGSRQSNWFTINDRIIYDWQAYAGRFNPKTEQAHLVSIRDFERFLAGRSFEKVTPQDAGAYRDHLVKLRVLSKETGGLSNSTVRHRASHLAAFFKWLRGQTGYRRLSASLPDYLALPRNTSALPLARDQRLFPSMDEAWHMVDLMPGQTIVQRRDRAMVAFAFVCGLRAGALTSLRIKHLNLDRRTVVQDASEMRAKNGKSYCATWFPRTEAFRDVFVYWVQELEALGFQAEDALFPEIKDLVPRSPQEFAVSPLATSRALQTAFARASAPLGTSYTPHSARHTLKALGARLCRTHEERKAWSMNLGHADEQITERHYGKMSAMRSQTIIEALNSDEVFTKEEQEMIIDFYENRFVRGTGEYRSARKLAERRERARGGDGITE